MLRATEADARGTELPPQRCIVRRIRVRSHTHRAILVGPPQDRVEITRDLRLDERHGAKHDDARGAVDRDDVTLRENHVGAADYRLLLHSVDSQLLGTAHARLAHAAGNDGRVRSLAAMRGQNALRGNHAVQVIGGSLPTHENDLAALGRGLFGSIGGEHDLADGRTRTRIQTLR